MREIKFRAWDKERNKMVPQMRLGMSPNVCQLDEDGELIAGTYDSNEDYYELTLMQFTGLKDKNDKEIYEGDIVKIEDSHYFGCPSVVEYAGGGFVCWNTIGVKKEYGEEDYKDDIEGWNLGFPADINEKAEVIGNIYENPELLEGDN